MDLNRVATFVQVVEAGNFTAAARRLKLPTSSVSRSVKKLERELGIVLLERTTRSISLTEAGRAYYERASEAVAGLDEAGKLASDAARDVTGVVRVAAPPEVMSQLATIIGSCVVEYPRIHVDVITTARGAELVGSDVDIAIVLGPLPDSSLIVKKLGVSTHRLYASSAYLERNGRPRRLVDLEQHAAVLYRGEGGRVVWELLGPRGLERVAVTGALSGDSYQFVQDAIAHGHGIGLIPEQCMKHHEHSGVAIEPVLPEYGSPGAIQSLVHPSRHLPRRVKLVRDIISEHLESGCSVPARANRAGPRAERWSQNLK